MTAKRLVLVCSLLIIGALVPRMVNGQGMIGRNPTPQFDNQGRDPIMFNVSCSTYAWTVVRSSDTIGRDFFVQAPSTNTISVSVVFSSAAPGYTYDTTTVGVDMAPGSSLRDSHRAAIFCRAIPGTSAQRIKGYWNRDRGDQTLVDAPGYQN